MAYKVAIDAAYGGNSGKEANGIIEKDYNLSISKYISDRLKTLGIENFLVRNDDSTLTDEERVNIIKNKYGTGNNIIVVSNRLNSGGNNGAEIMYALRNNSKLASLIANNLEDAGQPVLKYYQLRNSNNTALDDDYYIYDEAHLCLIGERTKKVYRLGDEVKVRCSRVDIDNREVYFDLIEEEDKEEIVPSEKTIEKINEAKVNIKNDLLEVDEEEDIG